VASGIGVGLGSIVACSGTAVAAGSSVASTASRAVVSTVASSIGTEFTTTGASTGDSPAVEHAVKTGNMKHITITSQIRFSLPIKLLHIIFAGH
jgi:hypothetical protein